MGNLYYDFGAFISANGQRYSFDPDSYTITAVDNPYITTFDVATSTTQKIYDSTLQGAFKLVAIKSDYPMHIELVTDDDATFGEVAYTIYSPGTSVAGVFGPPIVIPSNISYANYTVNFGGGTIDTINTIRARNISGTAGQVLIFAGIA